MSYNETKLARIRHIKKLSERVLSRLSALETSYSETLTSTTEMSEVIDARVDVSGNAHSSCGANIRYWQGSLKDTNEYLQEQIDDLSEVYIEVLNQLGNIQSKLREKQ